MNKYLNASDFTSIFIPRVFANITKERITHIVENVVPLGTVERIDMVEIDEKTNRVWVHFTEWYDTEFVNEFKKLLLDETKQAKIVYDEPWFWIVLKNTHRLANGQPKIRLDLEDGEISKPEVIGSPKSTVTFTTSSFTNPSKKNYSQRQWADVESDSDEELSRSSHSHSPSPSIQPQFDARPMSPPCPPPYPNPHYFPQQYVYQIPPIYPPLYYHVPPQVPHFMYQYNQAPIAPTLSTQPHPVASWNGVSIDDTMFYQPPIMEPFPQMMDYMDDIEDDAFLTEQDYQEILLELADDDDMYSDEDLYNMYLIEKEELALINQTNKTDDVSSDVCLKYDEMFSTTGTGFDEQTIIFHEPADAALKSDEIINPISSSLSRSLDKFIRPIIMFKEKISSTPPTSRPLKAFASSYKDMLTKKG